MQWLTCAADFLTRHKDAFDVLKNLSLIVAGLFGLYFLRRRANAQKLSSESSERQAETAEKGHINDRYMKAIDQLGAMRGDEPNLEVRLGGIYGLEQVSIESVELYPQIIEVLTAYVRTNAVEPKLSFEELKNIHKMAIGPKTDVQAVITALGRRQTMNDEKPMDFRGAYLIGYSFRSGNFEKAIFAGADCSGSEFDEANCVKADFHNATLVNTTFINANLTKANFYQSNCTGGRFDGAKSEDAYFYVDPSSKKPKIYPEVSGLDYSVNSKKD